MIFFFVKNRHHEAKKSMSAYKITCAQVLFAVLNINLIFCSKVKTFLLHFFRNGQSQKFKYHFPTKSPRPLVTKKRAGGYKILGSGYYGHEQSVHGNQLTLLQYIQRRAC